MLIDQLKKSVRDDIDSENFTLQAVFDRHIDEIMSLKKDGYTYKKIKLLLDLDIHEKHFRDLIYRARMKKGLSDTTAWPAAKKKARNRAIDDADIKAADMDADTHSTLSPDDWRFATGIHNLSERQIRRLEEKGFTPNKVKDLNLTTTTLINKHLATIDSQSKYN
jgi:hypothetical protein